MSEGANLVGLPVRRSEAELAADLRARTEAALRPVIAIMDEARAVVPVDTGELKRSSRVSV